MPRETASERAARVAADNAAARAIPTGTVKTDALFGTMTLGTFQQVGEDGWDIYEVTHSGYAHSWSSAVVARSFA